MHKLLDKLWRWLQFRTNWQMWRAQRNLKKSFERQLVGRQLLRQQINAFLKDFFGIHANSDYIPKKYKNSAEVKEATIARFGEQMDYLNIPYEKLFR